MCIPRTTAAAEAANMQAEFRVHSWGRDVGGGSVNFLPTLLRSEKLDRRAYLNHDKTGHHSASHSIWLLFCPAERKTTISGAAAAGDYGVPLSPRKIGGSSPTRSIASCKAIESDPRPPDNNDSANYEVLGRVGVLQEECRIFAL